jgi:transcriptional regulator with GAF, ATPase, and Fis domain
MEVLAHVGRVAPTAASVLITGETGTGKELIARAIHSTSKRKDKPFIKVNCAALPSGLVESELFGHEKGAFSGAIARRRGRFELADGGTIFLDEIGELPAEAQVKLLRVLQEREFDRVGGDAPIRVDVRVIAATNRDLLKEVQQKTFREDLFYRLNVFPVQLPPLRERRDDIPLLVHFLVKKFALRIGKHLDGVSRATMQRLIGYPWPGNIRELENLIKRYVILGSEDVITTDLQPRDAELVTADINFDGPISLKKLTRQATRALERKIILKVLHNHHWNRKQAARTLNISYRALLYKIRDAGLPPNRVRRQQEAEAKSQVAAD